MNYTLQCPKCNSTHIGQYRMLTGSIWCNECNFEVDHKEINNPFLKDTREWKDITQEKPTNCQEVFYYFDAFKKVYAGYYELIDNSELYKEPKGTYMSDCFYGKSGFLSGDVQYWMPRESGDIAPEVPTKKMYWKLFT